MRFRDRIKFAITNELSAEEANQIVKETIGVNPSLEELNRFFGTNIQLSGERLTSATYYACMQVRCNAIAKLPFKIMKWTEKGGAEKAVDHPLYKLFDTRPNPYMNLHDFLWATEFQRLHYGNAFWYMQTERGEINALYLLDSRRMEIVVDSSGILEGPHPVYYIYSDEKQGTLYFGNDEIAHFKNFALNAIKGTSIGRYLYETIENEQLAGQVVHEKYSSGLQDPIVVTYAGDLDAKKQGAIKKKFASLGGAKNAGKVVPIPTEFDVKQLETKLVNSQFFELQGLSTRQIANAFGVKGYQLNDLERSTYNNIEQQNKDFYCSTLQNVLTSYEQEIDYKLLAREDQKTYYSKFNVDSILRSDLPSRAEAYTKAIASGYMSIAEVRAKEDLPYMEGTDRLIVGNGASRYLEDLGKELKGGE